MPFLQAKKIGSYEILAPLGAGGMGEVYRATDTKLGRAVALKVLSPALAGDADYMARFTREAQVLASLNHPNIAAIYGLEESDGLRALVMELVEGSTLAERIAAGPLPLEEALNIATQIAEALEAAHEKGIVHRDLKPANVKITPEGVVKVLDFGLAKSTEASPAISPSSPTLTIRATQAGVILGTAGYMSPEQAAAKPVDKRADIWSFGVVLWEMLTGHSLFSGETVSHTLADVLRAQIDLSKLPAGTPPAVRALLRRCLDRNVRNRLRDIGEARVALEMAGQPAPEAEAPLAQPRVGPPGKLPWVVAAAAVVAVAILGGLYWRATRPVLRMALRFDVPFMPPERLHSFIAISPDGTRLAFVVKGQDGVLRIHMRLLDQPDAVALAGTEAATSPFFSPDGQWLAFAADGSLKKILLQGGAAVKLCDARDMRGGSWGDDGAIVFTPDNRSPLYRIPEAGGTPQRLTELKAGEQSHRFPQVLPGARTVLFSVYNSVGGFEGSTIQLLNLASHEIRTIYRGGFAPRYLSSGHLLWAHEGVLFAAALDLERAQIHGAPIPLLDKLADDAGSGLGNFEVSPAGIFVGVTGESTLRGRYLAWVDAAGKIQPLSLDPNYYLSPRISPDGKRLAMTVGASRGAKYDVFICELDRGRLTQLTFTGKAARPLWAHDGKHIVFQNEEGSVYWVRADGSSPPELLFTAPAAQSLNGASLSPDGKWLLYSFTTEGHRDIWTLPLDLADPEHPKAGKPAVSGLGEGLFPAFSPDGRWVAYNVPSPVGVSGALDIYVQPFPPTGGKWRIATGGFVDSWSRNSQELFFHGNSQIMAAAYRVDGNSFVAEKPRRWTQQAIQMESFGDIAPDGKRAIVTVRTGEKSLDTHLTFILNFTDELRRRIPR